jgi:hypothetical protein
MQDTHGRSRIRLIEGNAKSLRLKSNLEKDLAAAVYLCMRTGVSKCKSDAVSTGLDLSLLNLF